MAKFCKYAEIEVAEEVVRELMGQFESLKPETVQKVRSRCSRALLASANAQDVLNAIQNADILHLI